MKKLRKWILNGLLLLLLQAVPRAAITGQWDFNSNLDASIGQPILFWDAPTEAGSEFGTTTSFGIPDIDGEEAQVMKFPKTTPFFGGYGVPTGAAANGGGAMVNQYTIVMDVLFPEESSDKRRALVNTDGYDDAEYAVQAGNGLGVGTGSSDGVILPNTWHRIAYAVDLGASPSVVDKYIDGVKVGSDSVGGLDSQYGLLDMLYLFVDDTDETEPGYINSLQIRDEKLSDVLIGVLGGAKAEGILTGPPPNPYITSISPSPDTARLPSRSTVSPTPEIRIEIKDGESKVDETSIVLRLDDMEVTPEIVRDGSDVTITYTPDELLEPLSVHAVGVSFTDDATPPNNLGAQWQFAVGPFSPVAAEIALPLDTAGPRGFVARTVQGPPYIMEVNNPTNLAATVQRGIQQLNGTLRDIEGDLVEDESAPGPNPGSTYSVEGGLNHSTDEEVGHFLLDAPFPGIPGTTFHSTQFTTEFIGFLELEAGVHKLGVTVNASRVDVNDDDNFALFIGQNPRDAFSHRLGSYVRINAPAFDEDSQNDNEFTFYIAEAGLYPVRLVYVQSGRKGSLELYSFDQETGEKVLVNDPADARAIKAYQSSTSPRAGAAYIAELSPQPGTSGNDPAAPVRLVIQDGRTELDPGTLTMTFNGDPVTPEITKTGSQTTVRFQPDPNRTNPENEITLNYADNASTPNQFTHSWAFNSTVNAGGARTIVRGQWDFEQGDLAPTVGAALEYFDGPAGETATKTQFGTASAFGLPLINGTDVNVMRVPGDLNNRIGYIMRHGIDPNGGGLKVNQYSLIYDVLIDDQGPGAAGMLQVDDLNNTSDGDLFWQGNNFGQGQGGYEGTGIFTPGEWHRVAIAVDLSAVPPVITKFVDGIKQDDWSTDGLDGRRALQEYAILFADGDQDERRVWYVNSIQVREGKLSDGELVFLGGPEAAGIPEEIPPVTVAGQWDFNGNLNATIGLPLEYFDGPGGETETKTEFGTASSFGLPLLDGVDATVMHVPGDLNNQIGYIMRHGIEANGGGLKVNQYTLIWDVLLDTAGPGAAGMLQVDDLNNTSDGDLFWQGGNFGQGQGGYEGTGIFTAGEWHRVAIAVDLSATPPVVTKFVDGIKQDDWSTDGLDGRRALQEYAILFADGDADERRAWYVNSIQVRPGKMSDAQLALLGGPGGAGIPLVIPETSITGQWDFNAGLEATVGLPLEYFDGVDGQTQTGTEFGTTETFGVPDIAGETAAVMKVPGDLSNQIGYIMRHGISPNGGGSKVNQYTLIYDVLLDAAGPGAAGMLQVDDLNNTSDGDLFWQGNNFGQGQGGYEGTGIFTPGEWHRVAIAVDLSAVPPVITKFVDGIKQDDWNTDGLDGRRALQEYAILFADGDADERRAWYVNSIQVQSRKLTDAELTALGTPTAAGIPLLLGVDPEPEEPLLSVTVAANTLTISWPASAQGFVLEGTASLSSPVWETVADQGDNTAIVQADGTTRFFRLRK